MFSIFSKESSETSVEKQLHDAFFAACIYQRKIKRKEKNGFGARIADEGYLSLSLPNIRWSVFDECEEERTEREKRHRY
jgi:hypothetical protein